MLYTGIAWNAAGFQARTVDGQGHPTQPAENFAPGRIGDLIAYLRDTPQPNAVVIESSNGVLDGRLMAGGIEVHRIDPALLPPRPLFGSVPAADLAEIARREWPALTRLERNRGTQTGREDGLESGYADTANLLERLTADGKWISHGTRERPEVALTFDDGPQPPYTGQVLDILERYGIPATFFCVGIYARAHPEQLARMRDAGHSIGNHTWSHPFLPELSRPQFTRQIGRTNEAIAEVTGAEPTLFRPPYGSRSPEVMGWLSEIGITSVLWDVAPDDWAMPGTETISRSVVEEARPGSIVLLHDSGGDRSQTVAALPAMIEGLLDHGFGFVRVDDLAPAARPAVETS